MAAPNRLVLLCMCPAFLGLGVAIGYFLADSSSQDDGPAPATASSSATTGSQSDDHSKEAEPNRTVSHQTSNKATATREQEPPPEPKLALRNDPSAELLEQVARLQDEVQRLELLLAMQQPLRDGQKRAIRDKNLVFGSFYEELVDYFLEPELVTANPAGVLDVMRRLCLAAHIRDYVDSEGTWYRILEPEDDDARLQIYAESSVATTAAYQGATTQEVIQELQVSLDLPELPNPPDWNGRAITDGQVDINLGYSNRGLVEIHLSVESERSSASMWLSWDGDGFSFSKSPDHGAEIDEFPLTAEHLEVVKIRRAFTPFYDRVSQYLQ